MDNVSDCKDKYKICLYTGSLIDSTCIANLSKKTIEVSSNQNWEKLVEVVANIDEIKKIQQNMIKHYQGPEPWYLDGENIANPNEKICAFGCDDGEEGKVFIFDKNNIEEYLKVIDYGTSKGIPLEEMDFLKIVYKQTKNE